MNSGTSSPLILPPLGAKWRSGNEFALVCGLLLLGFFAGGLAAATPPVEVGKVTRLEIQAQSEKSSAQILRLHGGDARQQVLVYARHDSGLVSDCTRKVTFEVSPAGLARVDKNG